MYIAGITEEDFLGESTKEQQASRIEDLRNHDASAMLREIYSPGKEISGSQDRKHNKGVPA